MIPRFEIIAVALCVAGCSLAIGDIALPSRSGPRDVINLTPRDLGAPDVPIALDLAVRDAGADFEQPDAARDAGSVDVRVADVSAPDAAPDLGPDAAPPPVVDIAGFAGVWHLYGAISEDADDFVFEAQLVVNAVGVAGLLAPDGSPLNDPAPLRPDPEDGALVQLHLFPIGGAVRGTLDPVSGVGVLVAEDPPALVLAVRPGDARLEIPTGVFAQSWMAADPGYAELGVLSRVDEIYREGDRRTSRGEGPPPQVFVREDAAPVRHRLAPGDGTPPDLDRVLTAVGGFGAVGLVRSAGAGVGLAIAWSAQGSDLPTPSEHRAFCGGRVRDAGGRGSRATDAQFRADSSILFEGGEVATVARLGGLFDIQGAGVVIGVDSGLALVSPDERAYVLLPATIAPSVVSWGLGACVRVDEPVP